MEISAQEIIVLAGLVSQKKALVEVIGELHEDGNDERAFGVKRPTHCQYTGTRGEDCTYILTFEHLRRIQAASVDQIASLTQTVQAIDSLMPAAKPAKKGKAA